MSFDLSLDRIRQLAGPKAVLEGECPPLLQGIASLEKARAGDLSFLGNRKYRDQVAACQASLILVPADFKESPGSGVAFLRVEDPSFLLALICRDLEGQLFPRPEPGIHPSATIGAGAEVDPAASIGPGCVVGEGAIVEAGAVLGPLTILGRHSRVGRDSRLEGRVTVADHCILGARVRLQSGVVIGGDGFGYAPINGIHERIPQIGNVVLEDDVDVGANSTIDRARFGSTRIGRGTKIDNLVQIAHNVVTGKGCIFVAQVGISGSTTLGDYVIAGGQAGIAGHLLIGDGAKIAGQAGVVRDVPPGETVGGRPAVNLNLFQRTAVLRNRLPELFKRFDALEAQVQSPEKTN